jgi:hypothetical protein
MKAVESKPGRVREPTYFVVECKHAGIHEAYVCRCTKECKECLHDYDHALQAGMFYNNSGRLDGGFTFTKPTPKPECKHTPMSFEWAKATVCTTCHRILLNGVPVYESLDLAVKRIKELERELADKNEALEEAVNDLEENRIEYNQMEAQVEDLQKDNADLNLKSQEMQAEHADEITNLKNLIEQLEES